MAKRIGCICLAMGFLAILSESAEAQYRAPFQVIPRATRALGHGNGFGYHTCNPGPDVSYYQPWSHKNSFLISKSPEFLSRYGHELNKTPMQLLYSGQAAYGHSVYGAGHGAYAHPTTAAPLSADFVPTRRDEDKDDESRYEKGSDDDFGKSADDENVEDRFEREADAFENAEPREPGSLDSEADTQGSPSDAASEEEMTLLLPPTRTYIPASHSGR